MKMKNKQAEQNAAKLRHKEKLKANRRSQPNLERKEAFLNIKPTILILCEGKNTEPSYFNHFRLTSAKVVPVGLGFNTISLVNRAIELSQHSKYEQVWCVFDKDDFAEDHFNNSIQRAVANNLNVAYSNQAFEYWLILHFDDHQSGGMHRNDYNDKLTATGSTWDTISPKMESASKEIRMSIGEMQKGIYIVQAKMTDGRRWTGRFVKQ